MGGDNGDVRGYACEKGRSYAVGERTAPQRILTSTVKIRGSEYPLLPVRTEEKIPKALINKGMKEIRRLEVTHPVVMGQTIRKNLAGSGVNLIASASSRRKASNDEI
jgi:CxxC motif-containing protein